MNRSILWILYLFVCVSGTDLRAETPTKQVAAGTAAVLAQPVIHVLSLPEVVTKQITAPTALFYFSPTCPHCQDVMPAVNMLTEDLNLQWLGVASSRATRLEIERFEAEYKPRFEVIHDDLSGSFAAAVQARATPSIYIVQPRTTASADDPTHAVELLDAYTPFSRGMEGLLRLRSKRDDPFHSFDTYQGPKVCGSCHQQEHRSWVITHHASAYRTLYKRDRAQDLQCVGCHVTGIDSPGGFKTGDHGSPMRDVGCESCHGPGGPHNPDSEPIDAKQSCVRCHDAEHSIAFTVEKGLPHIDHFMAVGMTDQQLRERITAIGRGEAARPLLAFPEGPTVGSQACRSCHKSTHKSWSRSPHAKAMKRLSTEEQQGSDCLKCHATPKNFGPSPSAVAEDYRVDEAVGCESCHGAGAAHANAPTKDNIVGLGESCPECVIEAVCTSCHTPKWDPSWELKTRLEAAKH